MNHTEPSRGIHARRTFTSPHEVVAAIGTTLGPTAWLEIDQERVRLFAEATGDPQWIHLDAERAARESPYGRTIAHGYLTMSLTTVMMAELFALEGAKLQINYGLNRLRFPAPVLVGSRVRLVAVIAEAAEFPGGLQVVFDLTFENDRQEKPVCVAQSVARFYLS